MAIVRFISIKIHVGNYFRFTGSTICLFWRRGKNSGVITAGLDYQGRQSISRFKGREKKKSERTVLMIALSISRRVPNRGSCSVAAEPVDSSGTKVLESLLMIRLMDLGIKVKRCKQKTKKTKVLVTPRLLNTQPGSIHL